VGEGRPGSVPGADLDLGSARVGREQTRYLLSLDAIVLSATPLDPSSKPMSLVRNAQKTPIDLRNASLTAVVDSDRQNSGLAGPQRFAGAQNIYFEAPIKGAFSLLLLRLTIEIMKHKC